VRFPAEVDSGDARATGTLAEKRDQGFELGGVALGNHLHRAVRQISYPAGEMKTLPFAAGGEPEADALHAATDHRVQASGRGDGYSGPSVMRKATRLLGTIGSSS
jgi:hypothetical protein